MRFRIIEDCRDDYPVRVLCEALEVSPSASISLTRPERWQRERVEDEAGDAAQPSGEIGGFGASDFPGLELHIFFSAGVGLVAASQRPVETAV